ncbi:hypothetical protein Hanom_Chr12g01092311 [Helianthus anomalus]
MVNESSSGLCYKKEVEQVCCPSEISAQTLPNSSIISSKKGYICLFHIIM